MKRTIAILAVLSLSAFSSGCGTYNLCAGRTIRSGMPFDKVYSRMGKPDVGFGLPQKSTTERSSLYYNIPFKRYLVINFVGYVVDEPATSIEDRDDLVE